LKTQLSRVFQAKSDQMDAFLDAGRWQRAMICAKAFPEPAVTGRGKKVGSSQTFPMVEPEKGGRGHEGKLVRQARAVLADSPGQRAMSVAMIYPENDDKGGRGKKSPAAGQFHVPKQTLSHARAVLREAPKLAELA
jgi:hypothetical protein